VKNNGITLHIVIAMLLGAAVGVAINLLPTSAWVNNYLVEGVFTIGGKIFISIMKMLVVPIVLVSLICGVTALGDLKKLGRLGLKTLSLYLLTTALAISLALIFSSLFHVGNGLELKANVAYQAVQAPGLRDVLANLFPSNPFKAMVDGEMLQLIVFAILLGVAITLAGKRGQHIAHLFEDFNVVLMKLILMLMRAAPYGVFCLLAMQFAKVGFELVYQLMGYFATVLVVLITHVLLSNSLLIKFLAKLSPLQFFRKMYAAMLFAFSVSSSNASIPVVLETVRDRLGVRNTVASFVIPLGATINMDGTAIMQGVATVFIAHAYQIDIGLSGYLMVILTATLASIGTAGVPGVGLITLAMVLRQVGLPVEGIGLIIGVDRLLDMVRTSVNITGDAAVACVVAKSEKQMNEEVFENEH